MTAECALVIRTPSELIAALPYLLGYHPADNVAIVGLTGSRVDFGACYDLPPPDCDEADARAVATIIAETVARQEAASVVIVGFGPAHRVTPAVLRLTRALTTASVRVDDAMRVTNNRWWSYLCDDPRCCSLDGTPCLPEDSVIAAEATFRGHVALPSRRDLVAQVAPVDGPERAAMAAATERARRRFTDLLADDSLPDDRDTGRYGRLIRRAGRTAVRDAERRYRAGRTLTDDEVAWLGALLADKAVEDYALDRADPDEWRIRLWTDVLRRVEPAYVPAPACLLSFTAWRSGRGALARVAVDRALRQEPQHQLATLLHSLLGIGISPQMAVPSLRPRNGGGPLRGFRRRTK
ncbi:DUF4192 domain-containing protein [Actinoplanes sp. NPDC024001]|uniref:DUF4192 domain-containing protein n=1 Tax=Actinoplanes sp. NPDC024001 TaxID=3154598 RepID=UPI0033E4C544